MDAPLVATQIRCIGMHEAARSADAAVCGIQQRQPYICLAVNMEACTIHEIVKGISRSHISTWKWNKSGKQRNPVQPRVSHCLHRI